MKKLAWQEELEPGLARGLRQLWARYLEGDKILTKIGLGRVVIGWDGSEQVRTGRDWVEMAIPIYLAHAWSVAWFLKVFA